MNAQRCTHIASTESTKYQWPGTKGVKIDISEFVMELICICSTSVFNSVGNLSTLKLLVQEYHRNLQGRCTNQRKSIKKSDPYNG